MLLDLTELSSYLPLVSSFEFGNVSGKLFPCTEGRVRTRMTSAGTPRAGAFPLRPCTGEKSGQLIRWKQEASIPAVVRIHMSRWVMGP